MAHLSQWLREFRPYHRDDKGTGKIVKREDHLMDATRYLVVNGRLIMRTAPKPTQTFSPLPYRGADSWME